MKNGAKILIMIKFLFVLLFFVSITPQITLAEGSSSNANKGYFIGGLGYVDTNLDSDLDDAGLSSWSSDDESGVLRLGYGYYINESFSLEAHYNYAGAAGITSPVDVNYEVTTLALEGVYEIPINKNIDFIPRIGFSYIYEELTTNYAGLSYSVGDDAYKITYGAGIQVNDAFRFEYYQIENFDNPSVFLISYKFGFHKFGS